VSQGIQSLSKAPSCNLVLRNKMSLHCLVEVSLTLMVLPRKIMIVSCVTESVYVSLVLCCKLIYVSSWTNKWYQSKLL
jgi:hypothetical protein